jgi:peptide/nickel transport system substrate-binding protein
MKSHIPDGRPLTISQCLLICLCIMFLLPEGCQKKEHSKRSLIIAAGQDAYITSGIRANVGKYPLNANIFESLITFDEHYHLMPCLSTQWEYLGKRTWRFFLRRGVRFHDGTPVTAKEVKSSLQRVAEANSPLFSFRDILIRDDYTIDIITIDDNRILPYILSHPMIAIEKSGDVPIGTGPYQFVRYEKDNYLEVKRFHSYWGAPAGSEGIIFRFISDPATRLNALLAGEVDVVLEMPWKNLDFIVTQKDWRILSTAPSSYVALFVTPKGILKDPAIRKAVSMAIDRNAIAKTLWRETVSTRQTIIPPGMLGNYADLVKDIPYDPVEATRIFKGKRQKIRLISGFPNAMLHGELPEIIQSQLKQIGLEAEIVTVNDTGLYFTMLRKGEGDLWLERGGVNSADLTFLPHLLFHRDGYYVARSNTPAGSERFHESIENARRSPGISGMQRYTAEALREVIDNQVIIIPLSILPQIIIVRNDIITGTLNPTLLSMRWDRFSRK